MHKSIGLNISRFGNFDLLKILGMFLIIFGHFSSWGLNLSADSKFFILIKENLVFFPVCGNMIFIFISGYFLCVSEFKWSKFFRIWFQIFSISLIICAILFLLKIPVIGFYNDDYPKLDYDLAAKTVNLKDIFRSLTPVIHNNNWYGTCYLVFYLFVPFLNNFIKKCDKNTHFKLCILTTILFTIVPMIPDQNVLNVVNLFIFFLGYFICSYVRFYSPEILKNQKLLVSCFVLMIFIFICWIPFVNIFCDIFPYFKNHNVKLLNFMFGWIDRFPLVFASFLLFCIFRNLNIRSNFIIVAISNATFSVYLIHENRLLKYFLWHKIFRIKNFYESDFLILYMIFAIIVVFIGCMIFDLIRRNSIEKLFFRYVYPKIDYLINVINGKIIQGKENNEG